jgi:hypothetical protein
MVSYLWISTGGRRTAVYPTFLVYVVAEYRGKSDPRVSRSCLPSCLATHNGRSFQLYVFTSKEGCTRPRVAPSYSGHISSGGPRRKELPSLRRTRLPPLPGSICDVEGKSYRGGLAPIVRNGSFLLGSSCRQTRKELVTVVPSFHGQVDTPKRKERPTSSLPVVPTMSVINVSFLPILYLQIRHK